MHCRVSLGDYKKNESSIDDWVEIIFDWLNPQAVVGVCRCMLLLMHSLHHTVSHSDRCSMLLLCAQSHRDKGRGVRWQGETQVTVTL